MKGEKSADKKPKKKHLDSELEKNKQKLEETKNSLLRLQAEFANFKKRTEENQLKTFNLGVSEVIKEQLNVFDDFSLALKNSTDLETFKKGIELVYAKLISGGEKFGLEKIKTIGEQFNPYIHEALLAEESDKPEQTILEELQSGYKLKNIILRTAKVKVSKKITDDKNDNKK